VRPAAGLYLVVTLANQGTRRILRSNQSVCISCEVTSLAVVDVSVADCCASTVLPLLLLLLLLLLVTRRAAALVQSTVGLHAVTVARHITFSG